MRQRPLHLKEQYHRTGVQNRAAEASSPALALKTFLKQGAELGSWTAWELRQKLRLRAATLRAVIPAFSSLGYIDRDPQDANRWCNTALGNKLAGVRTVRPTGQRLQKRVA